MSVRGAVLGTGVVLALHAIAPNARGEEHISEEARTYFRNGVELLSAESYLDAYYQLKLAYEHSGSWKVLGNLGLAALKLERDQEALRYYEEYLRVGGQQIAKDEREAIERDVLLIRGNTATLTLVCTDPYELLVARRGSSAPAQAYTIDPGTQALLLRAGPQRLSARRADGKLLDIEILLTPGKRFQRTLSFEQQARASHLDSTARRPTPGPRASLTNGSEQTESRSNALFVTGLVSGGLGLAALGGGLWYGFKAKAEESDALGPCDEETKVCTEDRRSAFEDADRHAGRANVLFIVGGALTVAGTALAIYGGGRTSSTRPSTGFERHDTTELVLQPLVAPGFGAFLLSGNFE